jgi:hypothetical protein
MGETHKRLFAQPVRNMPAMSVETSVVVILGWITTEGGSWGYVSDADGGVGVVLGDTDQLRRR